MQCTSIETSLPMRVLDHASSMLAYWDRSLTCRYANRVYEKWFGKPGAELVGMHMSDLLGPEIAALNEPYVRAVLDGQAQTFERTITGPDGIRRRGIVRYHPDVIDSAVAGFIAEVSDVGPIKDLEARLGDELATRERMAIALDRNQAALEAAQELGRMGSWHWEIESDITSWSSGLYRLFGRDPGRLPPGYAEHARLYTPRSWRLLKDSVRAALKHGTPYAIELEFYRPGGGTGWLAARGEVERDGAGVIVGLHGTAQDVTESHCLLHALQGQTERLALALDAARLGIWRWNPQTDALGWENRGVRAILGIPAEEGGCESGAACFSRLLHPDDRQAFFDATRRFLEDGTDRFAFEGRIVRACDGQVRWVECMGKAIDDADGFRILTGTMLDVSEQVATRNALQNTVAVLRESCERKSQFLFALGHELRNYLSPLSAGLQLLGPALGEGAPRRIEELMRRQLGHIARLVDDIFDLRRIQSGELQLERARMSLNAMVNEAMEVCAPVVKRAGHTLAVALPDEELLGKGDKGRLTQAMVNLVTNACKFTPPGGHVGVCLRREADGMAALTVRDDGAGMAQDVLDSIFHLYVKLDQAVSPACAGLGIGLHLVKQIVELHGGSVAAASDGPGKGSTLTMRLPLCRRPARSAVGQHS